MKLLRNILTSNNISHSYKRVVFVYSNIILDLVEKSSGWLQIFTKSLTSHVISNNFAGTLFFGGIPKFLK